MKAIVLGELGGPERLELQHVPDPVPGLGQVLVANGAAGVNFADVLIRTGRYPQPPALPYIPGDEFAGTIVAVGEGVPAERVGERVVGFTNGGGCYAELTATAASSTYVLPDGMGDDVAAAFLATYLTAYIPLAHQVRIQPGRTVLVHAAAGGVGTAALQLVRALGCEAIATAGSPAKLDLARELGAVATVDYTQEGWPARVREATGGRGVDVVLDTVGGEIFQASLGVLAPLGAIVAIGFAGGQWPQVDPALIVGRNIALHGIFLGRLFRFAPQVTAQAVGELFELWRDGAIAPLITGRYPLAEASVAHELIESRRSTGKLVLIP